MAELFRAEMPASYRLILTGDWHVGSRGFHDKTAAEVVHRLKRDRHTYGVFMGDAVEGKPTRNRHFDPNTLMPNLMTPDAQFREWARIIEPSKRKWKAILQGNHDRYLEPDASPMRDRCEALGLPFGGYQTWLDCGPVRYFFWHGDGQLTSNAKDKRQRNANMAAALVRKLEKKAGDCHLMAMGHTHQSIIAPPEPEYALINVSEGMRARHFIEPTQSVAGGEFVPPNSRWYVNTGTLRRSGYFGGVDYAEVKGYDPCEISYFVVHVKRGEIADVEKEAP